MPRRDPNTGQFVSGDSYDDVEVVTFNGGARIPAADNTGAVGQGEADTFDGELLIDYDDIVDRNEELVLLTAAHTMTVYANSTETADGTVAASVEVSASPTATNQVKVYSPAEAGDIVDVITDHNDSIDLVGRPLVAMGGAPFSDTTTGVGGAGSEGHDSVELEHPPAEMARFHPRDELFLNGQIRRWNIDDAGVQVNVAGQHVYGVLGD